VLELAVALRRENPDRTAAAIRRILRTQLGWAPDERTLQRNFHRLGLAGPTATQSPTVFGRFEAAAPNDLWTGDVLHGLRIQLRKTYLFAFLDDHSRLLPGYRWGHAEDTVRLAVALRPALASRGVPRAAYVDNGSPFVDRWLLRACAKLGVRLIHSTPHRPEGRGKIERFFRTVRDQFLVEITGEPDVVGRHHVADLSELNRLFTAWVETQYHRTVHSETGQTPLDRWCAGSPVPLPAPETLTEAFLWEEHRRVAKTGTVSLHGNSYEVDPSLAGRKVELVFDPFDLTRIEVRLAGASMGLAVPHHIGRHCHPKAKPETPTAPTQPSGIDYAKMIETAHTAELARGINYAALSGATSEVPGQLDLLTGQEAQPR
jgi:transposase InsO family protein